MVSVPAHIDIEKLRALLKEDETPENVDKKLLVKKGVFGKKKEQAFQFSFVGNFKEKKVL